MNTILSNAMWNVGHSEDSPSLIAGMKELAETTVYSFAEIVSQRDRMPFGLPDEEILSLLRFAIHLATFLGVGLQEATKRVIMFRGDMKFKQEHPEAWEEWLEMSSPHRSNL